MRKEKELEFNKCLNEAIKMYMKEKGFVYKQVPEYVCSVSVFENKINLKSGKFSFFEVLNICKFLNIKLGDLLAMTEIIQKMEGGENEKLKMLRTGSRKNPERK